MTISGGWKKSAAAVNGEEFRSFQSRDNWGDGVDPRHEVATPHGVPSDVDPYVGVPEFSESVPPYIEDQFNISREPPYFPPDDMEPDGHDGIGTAPNGGVFDDMRAQEQANYARSIQRSVINDRGPLIGRSFTQTYETERRPSFEASKRDMPAPGQATRALRGRNSLALNNPGSPDVNFSGNYTRAGTEIYRWANRWMPRRGLTHTKRQLHLNLAAVAMPSAGPTGDAYTPYTSPFDGRVGSLVPKRQSPMQRREPRPWDEDITSDGTDENLPDDVTQYRSWGL